MYAWLSIDNNSNNGNSNDNDDKESLLQGKEFSVLA